MSQVEAAGATVDELLRNLGWSYPGLRCRVVGEHNQLRPHIKLRLGHTRRWMGTPSAVPDVLHVNAARSGG